MRKDGYPWMAALAAVCVLAGFSLACGGFKKYQCKSRQSEAQTNLASLASSMEAHRAIHGTYPSTMEELEKSSMYVPIESKYYKYELVSSDYDFTIIAEGTGEMAGDGWKIDSYMDTTNVLNACD